MLGCVPLVNDGSSPISAAVGCHVCGVVVNWNEYGANKPRADVSVMVGENANVKLVSPGRRAASGVTSSVTPASAVCTGIALPSGPDKVTAALSTEEGSGGTLNVALTCVSLGTPVAPSAGVVAATVNGGGGPGGGDDGGGPAGGDGVGDGVGEGDGSELPPPPQPGNAAAHANRIASPARAQALLRCGMGFTATPPLWPALPRIVKPISRTFQEEPTPRDHAVMRVCRLPHRFGGPPPRRRCDEAVLVISAIALTCQAGLRLPSQCPTR